MDNDPYKIQITSGLMSEFFPSIKGIRYILGDALHFVNHITSYMDVICVDLYTDEGYPYFLFQQNFWSLVQSTLQVNGKVIVNLFGLPEHLHPFSGKSPQLLVLRSMFAAGFKHIYSLPYRRNYTIIAYKDEREAPKPYYPKYELNEIDRLIFQLLSVRLSLADNINIISEPLEPVLGSRRELNLEMENRWPNFIQVLNTALVKCGFEKIQKHQLKELIMDPTRAIPITEWLITHKLPEASFIPNFVGALAFSNDLVHWYPRWLIDNGYYLFNYDKRWFVNVALWQFLSILANPLSHFGYLLPEAKTIVEIINKKHQF